MSVSPRRRVAWRAASNLTSSEKDIQLTIDTAAQSIWAAVGSREKTADLTQSEVLVLMCIAYFRPITPAELFSFFSEEISRDLIGHLRGAKLLASGPQKARHPAHLMPMSRRNNFCSSSASLRYVTCPTSKRLRTPGCCRRKSCWRGR